MAYNTPPAPLNPLRISIMQGDARVSADPRVVFGTVLGSCVATCLFDPAAGVGGMNHFLLSEPPNSHTPGQIDVHYGTYLMEMLINEMLAYGADKSRIKSHLYGGANLREGMGAIGTANATFAQSFLEREGIEIARVNLGGTSARRVDFRPASGQVRCRIVEAAQALPAERVQARPKKASGDVEFF